MLLALALATLIENVHCTSDPAQTYTLYLPSQYTTERRFPLLFVFDPRGRGTVAADLFREGAEANGWILISSNRTRSDTDPSVNDRAVNALLGELGKYSIDSTRMYAAGFSGTANVAWFLAQSHKLAGIIVAGPPYIPELDPPHATFAYWSSAGNVDFNFLDAKRIHREIIPSGRPHHFETFEGPHQWMPQPLATKAIAWMEHPHTDDASVARETSADRWELRTVDQTIDAVRRILASGVTSRIERQLGLSNLQKLAAGSGERALASRRVLERLFVQTSFYLPEEFFAKHDYRSAATMLMIAALVKPESAWVQYNLGRANAKLGHTSDALDAFDRAVTLGFSDKAQAERDADLASIRSDPRFAAILSRIPVR